MKKRIVKILIPIFIIVAILVYGVNYMFFDIQRIDGEEVICEVDSPNGENTVIMYLNNGGATTDYAVLGSVRDNQTEKERNIYWQYHCEDAEVKWVSDETVVINGVELDVWEDEYDYRR